MQPTYSPEAEAYREKVFARQKELGIAPADAELSRVFDRAWAEMLVQQAMERLVSAARAGGGGGHAAAGCQVGNSNMDVGRTVAP